MEKRTLRRIPVSLEANILLDNHNYATHIINISESGLHIIVSPGEKAVDLTPGAEHRLAVTVPTGEIFHLHCRVRWSSSFLHYRLTKIVGLLIIDPPPEYKTFFRTTLYEVRNDISHSPIAVIGMAGYYPGAPDLKRFWENILARRREFRQIPEQRLPLSEYYDPDPSVPDKTYANLAAVIDGFEFDWIQRGIPKTVVASTDIAHWLALEVALKALTDAGYTNKNIPSDRAGVVLGNTLTGEHSRTENMRLRWPYVRKTLEAAAVQKGMPAQQIAELTETMEEYYKSVFSPITEDTLAGNLSNTIAGRICNFLNLNGGGYTVDGACSSSLIAVATAATALSNGKLDIVLAGGVDISLDTFELIGFAKTNALTKDDMRVYDRRANGFIPGEGSGFAVLKRLEDARADGDRVYAVLQGWGISSDGKGGITAPKAKNQALAIRRAYTQAGYGLRDLDFIEGHGTGTPAGDKAELEGIALAMDGGSNNLLRFCGITSLKSIIGHTKAASGIGGFIKAVIAVNRRVLPPTAGCTDPNPVFDTTAHSVYPILQGEIRNPGDTIRAGVSGMGFGGINCHVTLESGDAPAKNLEPAIDERSLIVSHQNTELFALCAESPPRLLERVRHLTSVVQWISIGEMVDLANHLALGVSDQAPWRAAVVAATPRELTDSLKHLEKMLTEGTTPRGQHSRNTQQTLWLGNHVQQHRIGFLFPGQGSQQLNMARTLVERFPWARDLADQVDSWLVNNGFEKISPLIYRPLDRALHQEQKTGWADLLTKTETAQPAICLASLLWVRYLDLLGIKPVIAGGHSLGELTAFCMAGALSEKDLLGFAAFRGKIMAADTKEAGIMASCACDRKRVEEILQQIDGYAVVANINSPTQTVISGEKSAVDRAIQLAAALGITCKRLPVANAFHSQFVIGAADLLHREAQIPGTLEHIDIKLLSCMEGAEVAPGLDLRNHFAQQMVSRVDFLSLVNKMAQECDLMVEVGPGRILTNLTRSCLDRDAACFPVEAQANDDRSLNTFLGCYFVRGGKINWPALYDNRLVRPFVPPAERLFIDNPCERPLAVIPAGTGYFQTSADEPVVSLLAAAAEVPAATIANYIHRRSRFLGSLIKADLDDSHARPAPEPLPLPESFHPVQPSDIIEARDGAKSKQERTGHDLSIADVLLELIEKRTGFPTESLSLDLRLLDDLNLDSIKAAELIAETAKHLHLAGEIDPAQYANSTIQKIADAFEHMQVDQTAAAVHVGQKKHTADQPSWVRNFVVHYEKEPLPRKAGDKGALDLKTEKILILSEATEHVYAESLHTLFSKQGAEVQTALFTSADPIDLPLAEYTCCIGVLPRMPGCEKNLGTRLTGIVDRLRTLATAGRLFGQDPDQLRAVFVQFGNGSFGLGTETSDVEQCCTMALAASLHFEQPTWQVRVIDFAPTVDPARLAEKVQQELSTAPRFAAAGYDQELTRSIPKMILQEPATYRPRPISWSADDVILVTGGAKGITAECALELARTTHAAMALVGSSPYRPEDPAAEHSDEISRTLGRFDDAGLTARYYQCDVVDPEAVNRLVAEIRLDLGNITGIIHGSALNIPRDLLTVSTAAAVQEVSPKVIGAVNLCRTLADAPPKLFVGFSSIIGVSGMIRNGWYGFSNEALNLILRKFNEDHPATAVLCIAFSIWDEVGMGVRMGSTNFLARMGIGAIPAQEGVRRFLHLFRNDPGAQQVIVAARLAGLDTIQPEPFALPANSRFLENIVYDYPGVEVVTRARLSLQKDPYIKDHLWRGTYLFPTVFGLEAMAQAVGYVSGETDFTTLQIEDICLERPIPVSPDEETEIEVRAEVLEKETGQMARQVRVRIATEQTGFHVDHFSATFVLYHTPEVPLEHIELLQIPLDIDPEQDLYNGKLLFQGPLYHRLGKIYSLDANGCVFSSRSKGTGTDPAAPHVGDFEEEWLLGDPYFRDSLLHVAQLPVSQHISLPLKIARLERFRSATGTPAAAIGKAIIETQSEREITATVFVVNEQGRIIERLRGYVLKVLEYHDEYPTPEEITDPGKRDARLVRHELARRAGQAGLQVPVVSVRYLAGLPVLSKEERQERELFIVRETVGQFLADSDFVPEDISVRRLPSGRPQLESAKDYQVDISLSHNGCTLLCVAGSDPQGCDLESITPRSPADWTALLGRGQESLRQQLLAGGDTADRAGTRIWAAREALFKATTKRAPALALDSSHGDTVILRDKDSDHHLHVLTFPIDLTRAPERMVALVLQQAQVDQPVPSHKNVNESVTTLSFDRDSYKFDIIAGPKGQPVFVFQFPVTFKEASNPSRTVYFSQYFSWLGKLREFVIQPIYEQLVNSFSTGKWGMVTNHAETHIFGTALPGDIIEGHVWFDKLGGKKDSTVIMCFEWWKRLPQGEREKIAVSEMGTTWVAISGHSTVEVRPLPEFGREFLRTVLPPQASQPDTASAEPADPTSTDTYGDILFQEHAGPVRESTLLKECVFETTLEDSNLVGNIYFSNYYLWQGRVRDRYLNETIPEYFGVHAKPGEFRCVKCRVDHLGEAMPFDRITVRMYRAVVHARAVLFNFGYYLLTQDGKRRKIGHGTHEAAWYEPDINGIWTLSDLPLKLRNALIPAETSPGPSERQAPAAKAKRNNYDVIVIGAGIGGLTAGALLSKRGKRVVVLEQHHKPGGFCTSWQRKVKHNGKTLSFTFDAGVHDMATFSKFSPTSGVLRELGLHDAIHWQRVDHEYISPGSRIKVPRQFNSYMDILCREFPKEQEGLSAFFHEIQACYGELHSYQHQVNKGINLRIDQWYNIRFVEMLERFIRDRRLRELLSILVYYITDDPASVSALTAIPLFGYYIEGGTYPTGGSQVLSNTLAGAVVNNGGQVRLRSRVSAINFNKDRVDGVRLDTGEILSANTIISNADVRRTFLELVGKNHIPTYFSKRINKLRPSTSAFLVSLGVDFVPDVNPATFVLNGTDALAVMVPSKVDPSLASAGCSCITLVKLIPHEQAVVWNRQAHDYIERKRNFGDKLIARAEKAIPELSAHIVYRQDASPATFARYTRATDGAIYGVAVDDWKPAMKTPIKGLYLAGAGTTIRPGVDAAVFSGVTVADAITPPFP